MNSPPRRILHPVLPEERDDQRGEGEHDERRGEDDRCPPPAREGHFRLEKRVGVGASVDHEEGDEEQGQAARPPERFALSHYPRFRSAPSPFPPGLPARGIPSAPAVGAGLAPPPRGGGPVVAPPQDVAGAGPRAPR